MLADVRTSARSVALLLFAEVELLDVAGPAHTLTQAGRQWNWRPFRIVPVAKATGRIATRGQLSVEATSTLDNCPGPEILIIPGGYGARRAATDPTWVDWVRGAGRSADHIVSIGGGAGLLAAAGLLDGVRVAVGQDAAEWIAELAPRALLDTEAAIATSDRFLSASASGHAVDVSVALIRRVLGDKQARLVAQGLGLEQSLELDGATPPVFQILEQDK